ncbi:MAG: DUF4339 domain-containing protein [Thermomicrobiales bacterium]
MFPPLPPPNAQTIFVGTQQGPLPNQYSVETLVEQVRNGQLPSDAAIWYEGLANWVRLTDHPELRDRLNAPRGGGADPAPQQQVIAPATNAPRLGDDQMDRRFGELIKSSWHYYHANEFAHHVDEVFIGAVITSTLDNGYSLIDINSDGSNHYLRFQQMQEGTRILYQLHHLATSPAEAKILGHISSVTIGYGERSPNVGRLWNALKAEFKSGYIQTAEPGTITIDAEVESGYMYAQVDMYWNISDYVSDHYETDYPKLTEHIAVSINALRKYLHGRMS